MPKENTKVTFVLAGVRAPRTARNATEKPEPYGAEAYKFASKYLQRDVEIGEFPPPTWVSLMTAFDSTDKQGGFIGAMYLGGTNVAVELVREGLASVHSFSADGLPFGRELANAEEEAKSAKKNVSPLCASIDNAHSSFGPTIPAKKSRSRQTILLLLRRSISMFTSLLSRRTIRLDSLFRSSSLIVRRHLSPPKSKS